MRVPAIVAGVAVVLAACGGQKKPEGAPADTGGAAAAPTAAAATGANHDVQMVMVGANSYQFQPNNLTIKVGDQVTFKSVSGQMHDVAFYADSIPPGAAAVLNAAIPDQSAPLATQMIPEGQSVTISFAGAPTGVYKLYCIPHQAMGMHMTITVQ